MLGPHGTTIAGYNPSDWGVEPSHCPLRRCQVKAGRARMLGASNVTVQQLEARPVEKGNGGNQESRSNNIFILIYIHIYIYMYMCRTCLLGVCRLSSLLQLMRLEG